MLSSANNQNEVWVYRVRRRKDNKIVAIKLVTIRLNQDHRNFKEEGTWLNEVKLLEKLNHYNETLTIFEVFQDDDYLFIVSEFCECGDLESWIKRRKLRRNYLSNDEIRYGIAKILQALVIVHANGIIHRDIKPMNILIRQEHPLELCLADFGESIDLSG